MPCAGVHHVEKDQVDADAEAAQDYVPVRSLSVCPLIRRPLLRLHSRPRPLPQLAGHYIKRSADDLYAWQKANRPAADAFVLHDGPPYANGALHVGHALNKILKDMILRVQVQQGRQVDYVPGWDCHGLPIELKAVEKKPAEVCWTPTETRRKAQALAARTVAEQMKCFRSYGVMGDWEGRWTTMDAAYEIRQLRLFQQMVKQGLIYRRYKPVYWSPSSSTALAESELEYRDDHVSNSAWVRFRIDPSWRSQLPELKAAVPKDVELWAVAWTTTPWTLPANQAIGVHDDLEYTVVGSSSNCYLVASSRVEAFLSKVGGKDLGVSVTGSQLRGLQYQNPLRGEDSEDGELRPIIHADFVSADSGSGLVHLAPGHGFDDYEVCKQHGLPITAPISDSGTFTGEAVEPEQALRMSSINILDGGSEAIIDLLGEHALATEKYIHKYPYDWRTKKPIVIRATKQWFADVGTIKDEALAALDKVRFTPQSGKKRLQSFVQGRSEWCISRQRTWGVPIPALYDELGNAVVTEDIVDHMIHVIQMRGINAWYVDDLDDAAWIPASMRDKKWRRGTDTMDVWFDSGSSWSMMPGQADVYLEGSDQHRGWFQSSLLTRIAAGGGKGVDFVKGAPFKQLITHGFTLDQQGKKMSKSLGNVIEPHQVMDGSLVPPVQRKGKVAGLEALGADVLRLWTASSDYTHDVVISTQVLKGVHASLLKYRSTIKMLLGSVHAAARSAPLTTADHVAIAQLQQTMKQVEVAFSQHEFYKAYSAINRWVNKDLSTFYLEIIKDRLYCGDGGGVLEPLLNGFLRMLAPITPALVEEAWDHRPEWLKQDA